MFKKIGAELILGGMILPWAVWVTVAVFSLQKADAVTETRLDKLIETVEEIRGDVKSLINRR